MYTTQQDDSVEEEPAEEPDASSDEDPGLMSPPNPSTARRDAAE